MKNKKRITLCGCKLSLQPTLRLIKDLPVFLKKYMRLHDLQELDEPQHSENFERQKHK